jgi:hypothetical protein
MMRRHEFITLLGGVSASHISKYAAVSALLLRRFELLDERSKAARDRRRGSVVLRLETLPDGPQPSASIGNSNRALARGRGHPRRYPGERLRFLGSKFGRSIAKRMLNDVPADPVIEAVGCLNRGVDTVLYRRRGHLGSVRSTDWPVGCRHGDAPLS